MQVFMLFVGVHRQLSRWINGIIRSDCWTAHKLGETRQALLRTSSFVGWRITKKNIYLQMSLSYARHYAGQNAHVLPLQVHCTRISRDVTSNSRRLPFIFKKTQKCILSEYVCTVVLCCLQAVTVHISVLTYRHVRELISILKNLSLYTVEYFRLNPPIPDL
jgi:hypothetical protein